MGKKKQTHKLSKKQLEYYRQLLFEKMQEILGDVSAMEESVFQGSGELSSMPVHLADIGTDSYEQEFSLGLVAEERKILLEIQHALTRIAEGTFGICEGLGIPIESNRLEAIPWTRFSMEYARMLESGQDVHTKDFKRRPIDIQREEDLDDDEDYSDQDEDLTTDDQIQSLDALDDDDEDEEDDRQRNSA